MGGADYCGRWPSWVFVSCLIAVPNTAPSAYIPNVPGPGGRQPAKSVRTPQVAAARGVCRRFVRPGALRAGRFALKSGLPARFFCAISPSPRTATLQAARAPRPQHR